MTATAWCTHCHAKLNAKSEKIYGRELTCPKCQRQFAASKSPPIEADSDLAELAAALDPTDLDEALEIANHRAPTASFDPFGEIPTSLPPAPALQVSNTEQPSENSEQIGPDGLTNSQRRYDLVVRIIGYSIIGITVIAWIVVGLRPHEGMSPLYTWIAGSFPVLLMGLMIGVYGAVFDEEAKENRRQSLLMMVTSAGVIMLFVFIALAAPILPGSLAIFGILVVGATSVSFCLGLASALTGQSFWKILLEFGQNG